MGAQRRHLTLICLPLLAGSLTFGGSIAAHATGQQPVEPGQKPTSSAPSQKPGAPSQKPSKPAGKKTFDLESHRGGRGETTEESRRAFEKSLALGVSTLEFDIVLTKDKVPAVWHDPKVLDTKCTDTKPATAGDPMYPYVGKLVHELTWAQVQTLDCGKKLDNFPYAEVVKGNKIIKLSDVFDLVKSKKADVRYNIETKIEGENRKESATPEEFVKVILGEVNKAGVADKVMIQSFDWRSLPLVKKANPKIPTVLLWDETTWKKGSPWTGDADYDAMKGDILAAAKKIGVDVLSPGYSQPYGRKPGDKDFKLIADKALIEKAHQAGLKVVPWTLNDVSAMEAQMDAGADGIITDYPTKLRELMQKRGLQLPPSYS
ncbi:glycerophosphoryl diester phosphodiesterase [Austwickia chelonae]|uniref:Putative esterase n=1 Tax=Austwickia chelonae NBRC 105200 TaxID=1184607 RepID=K6VQV6_9MICO|nr:glycerophosphodiester phosphodiesterase family protein [Austwickia chelonae]GAB79114.1 putative esterase [Austwickia chelonae NBRC 105200]SEW42374.1 glycerophosphoryl diester phosphodiesterase [Austwickia chelonae]